MAKIALSSGFFDSVNYDKVYDAEDFGNLVKILLAGQNVIVSPYTYSGNTISFPNGIFFAANGQYGYHSAAASYTVPANSTLYFYATIDTANRNVKLFTDSSVPAGSVQVMAVTTTGSTISSVTPEYHKGYNFSFSDIDVSAVEPTFTAPGKFWAPVDGRINTVNTGTTEKVCIANAGGSASAYVSPVITPAHFNNKGQADQWFYFWGENLDAAGFGVFSNIDTIPLEAVILEVDMTGGTSGNADTATLQYKAVGDTKYKDKGPVTEANIKALLDEQIRDIGVRATAIITVSDSKGPTSLTYGTRQLSGSFSAGYRATVLYTDDSSVSSVLKWSIWTGSGYTTRAVAILYGKDDIWLPCRLCIADNGTWKERDVRTI